jgi:hypothetical protein
MAADVIADEMRGYAAATVGDRWRAWSLGEAVAGPAHEDLATGVDEPRTEI